MSLNYALSRKTDGIGDGIGTANWSATCFVGTIEAVFWAALTAFALFASASPAHNVKTKATNAVELKCLMLAIIIASKLVVD